LQTAYFSREIGGIPVEGPTSSVTVRVASSGVVGFGCNARNIQPTATAVTFRPADEISRELEKQVSSVVPPNYKTRVVSARLVYYEQGALFVQPAYEFRVEAINPKGFVIGHKIIIAASHETPEPIAPSTSSPSPFPQGLGALPPLTPAPAGQKPDPTIQMGFFFGRLDYNGWATDPGQFWQSIPGAYALGTWGRTVPPGYSFNMTDFQFNFPWMWQTNLSSSFIDRAHFAIVSGHGNHFTMASFQDWGDAINVTGTEGYGAFNANKGLTNFIVWRGCLVIPTPDPADGFSGVGPAVGPWFSVFQGVHGVFGFHSEMAIESLEGQDFGAMVGLAVPVLTSWLTSVQDTDNSCPTSGTSEWECPSAVVVTGHENDTIFDLDPVPPPDSLTVWWVSPPSS
jgi:hypothetical protein